MSRPHLLFPGPLFGRMTPKLMAVILLAIALILLLPWVSFTSGSGLVTAIDPNERVQSLTAPVTGFIRVWHAKEGTLLRRGELIAELSDNDPDLLQRYELEKDAAQAGYQSALIMRNTAQLNLDRQKTLFNQGLSARKDYEKAKIELSKLDMEVAKAQVAVTKAETQFTRQSSQQVRAPRDGTIIRILPGEKGQLIKEGAPLAIFSPDVLLPAVELWVDGNDASMVIPGQKAQIQFEGWPSLQIAGWPALAINNFPAKVHLVDQASSYQGKFRVLLVPDGPWPSQKILRLGIHARGHIQLANSFILRELWRKLNNFPAFPEPIEDELQKMLSVKPEEGKKGEKSK
jgi:biotin carboxyl carrier protein